MREKSSTVIILAIGLALILNVTGALASEPARDDAESQAGGPGENRHHLALFLGNTHSEDEDAFSYGLEYEFRLNRAIGLGGIAEHAAGELSSTLAIAALFYHPFKGLVFVVAPGVESAEEEKGRSKESDRKTNFAVRVGVSYEFEFGRFSVAPGVNLDLVDGEESQVYGVTFGVGF